MIHQSLRASRCTVFPQFMQVILEAVWLLRSETFAGFEGMGKVVEFAVSIGLFSGDHACGFLCCCLEAKLSGSRRIIGDLQIKGSLTASLFELAERGPQNRDTRSKGIIAFSNFFQFTCSPIFS
jgi:hypothetical protein